ncbi:hypothetical protein BST61_g5963 [Cercospora zeina]
MTKTQRKAASSAADAFDRHYAAIWGEERWQNSLRPALEQPTRYACLLNRYASLDATKEKISNRNTDEVTLGLPQPSSTESTSHLPLNLVVRQTKIAEGGTSAPSSEPFPAPLAVPGQPCTHWNLDAASVLVAQLLNVKNGDNVLDLCAAPGGKSISLAQNIWVQYCADDSDARAKALDQKPLRIGTLHSNEADASRQRRLADNLRSYLPKPLFDAQRISTLRIDGTNPKAHYELVVKTSSGTVGYDKVLIDAPCSSERHIIHAHANAKLGGREAPEMVNWRPGSSKRLAETQLKLLMTGLRAAKVGATAMYATCSIEPTENDGVIEKMLSQVEKERRKGLLKWTVKVGFGAGSGDVGLETDLGKNWAERTKLIRNTIAKMAPKNAKPEPREATSFLDLPPELRNRIYELCLIVRTDEAIRPVLEFRPSAGAVRRQIWGYLFPDPTFLEVTPKLLATCQQIYQEAMPVLYGSISFIIHATSAHVGYPRPGGAYQFPPMVQAMRIIELRGTTHQKAVNSMLLVLQNMLDLNTLRIDASLIRNFRLPHTMAKALLPLLQGIHAERKGTDRKQAMDVIEFTNLWDSGPRWNRHRMTTAFAEEVKAILQKAATQLRIMIRSRGIWIHNVS